jgi:hypothetical protein
MIPVAPQPEPANFHKDVTQKANAFLKKNSIPGIKAISNRHYWRNALGDLHEAYCRICSYSGLWCPRDSATVDHFVPIHALAHTNPRMAYEWENFRLSSRSMNSEKYKFRDVLDPFTIEAGWFVMDFPSLFIGSSPDLNEEQTRQVKDTIRRLKLNKKEKYIKYRQEFLLEYCELFKDCGKIEPALNYLERKAPFIAYELKRQELTVKVIKMMKYSKNKKKK